MIDTYIWSTPNSYKITIMLEETALPYRVVPVNMIEGEQLEPKFLALNPNNKVPVIRDDDGPTVVFESGAILLYLAEKAGMLLPSGAGRWTAIEWLFWQCASMGPLLGQAHYFRVYASERVPHAIERYTGEAGRLYKVLDGRLGEAEYIAGDYSVADIACFPWVRSRDEQGQDLADYPNIKRWYETIAARPAVVRALEVLADKRQTSPLTAKQQDTLFGARQRRSAN
jgi:GST-like protein